MEAHFFGRLQRNGEDAGRETWEVDVEVGVVDKDGVGHGAEVVDRGRVATWQSDDLLHRLGSEVWQGGHGPDNACFGTVCDAEMIVFVARLDDDGHADVEVQVRHGFRFGVR